MRKKETTLGIESRRMISEKEAADYLGLGRTKTRTFAEECGAVRRYGRRVLYDRAALDHALDQMAANQ